MERKFENVCKFMLGKNQPISISKRRTRSVDIHTHDYYELEFILQGVGEHVFNGKNHDVSRGRVFLVTPADCHVVKTNDIICLWNVSFKQSFLSEEMTRRIYSVERGQLQVDEKTLQKLVMCAELMKRELQTTGKVKLLLEYMLSLVLPNSIPEKTKPLEDVLMFAKTHFRESPTVEDASKIACLSPVYFGNLFKKTYGVSFTEYVNAQKVECAKLLLSNGMSVAEACFESGFNSLSNFLKVFKTHTGVVPKEYKC